MSLTIPLTPTERFVATMAGLRQAVAARIANRTPWGTPIAPLAPALIVLLWGRLGRMVQRFVALATKLREGRLQPPRRRPARPRTASRPPPVPPPGLRCFRPRGRAWLIRLVPAAAGYGSQLDYLLHDPEMVAMIAAAPQMARILRPLCQALGVTPAPPLPRPGTPPEPWHPPEPRAEAPPAAASPKAPARRDSMLFRPPRDSLAGRPMVSGLSACGPPATGPPRPKPA
jgi:hypothetical protein